MNVATSDLSPRALKPLEVIRFYFTIPLLVALLLIVTAEARYTSFLNGGIMDAATSRMFAEDPRVVIVEPGPADNRQQVNWSAVARRLQVLGAEKVVFSFDPGIGPQGSGIIIGRSPQRVPGSPGKWQLPRSGGDDGEIGASFISLPEQGISRSHRLWIPAPDGRVPTIEALAADRRIDGPASFYFPLPRAETIPKLQLGQLQSKLLSGDLLSGKVAVVGPGKAADPARYSVGPRAVQRVNQAEYHARAIQSLLTGRDIIPVIGFWRASALLVACLLLVRLLAPVDASRFFRNLAALVVGTLAIGALALVLFGLLLPIVEILIAQLLLGVIVYRHKEVLQDERLARMIDRTTSYVARHNLLQDLQRWPDYLATSARLAGIDCWLLVQRTESGDLEIIGSHGAGSAAALPKLSENNLLRQADAQMPNAIKLPDSPPEFGERALLVRLGDEQSIYWVFAVGPHQLHQPEVLSAGKRIARRIGEALSLEQGRQESKRSSRFKPLDDRVAHSMDLIVSRAAELRQSLGSMQTATILYDAAGMPLQTNASMLRILGNIQLEIGMATPVDVVTELTGTDCEAVRAMLNDIILRGGELRLSSGSKLQGRRYVVRVTNVHDETGQSTGGLLFEAIDVTEVERLIEIQRELAVQVDSQIRNDLEVIQLAAGLAADSRVPAEGRDKALRRVLDATARARDTLSTIGQLLDRALKIGTADPYPVNPNSSLIRAVGMVQSRAEDLGVTIAFDRPELTTAVIAEPTALDDVLEAMLRVALSDSPRGSTVKVSLVELDRTSDILIHGGFGMVADKFKSILSSSQEGRPREFRLIGRAIQTLPTWGGELEAKSEPGVGYSFHIRLRKA